MTRRLVLEFTKMNGAGNDFIVVDNRFFHFTDAELQHLARRLCPRRVGVGADGLLALSPPASPEAHFRMRYVNADGSVGTMCGNGARCLVRYARLSGIEAEDVAFDTDAGLYRAHAPADPAAPVRLFVPPPRDFAPEVALAGPGRGPVCRIWTGTEHVVRFVPEVAAAPVAVEGPAIRADAALAPAGANVNFVEVAGEGRLRVRTYEKGVEAETLACGTGALASALVARLTGRVGRDALAVEMPGGVLHVGFRLAGGAVRDLYLEGPAEVVYRGSVEV